MIIKLRKLRKTIEISNGYSRGLWGALTIILSKPINRMPYIYDIRGDLLDENKAVGTNFLKYKFYMFLENSYCLLRARYSGFDSFKENN